MIVELRHLTAIVTAQYMETQLRDVETKLSRVENELAVSNATLVERTNQLSTIQREVELRRGSQTGLEQDIKKDQVS